MKTGMLNTLTNLMAHEIGIPRELEQQLKLQGQMTRPCFSGSTCHAADTIKWQNWPFPGDRPLLWKKHPLGGFLAHTPDLPGLDNWVMTYKITEWECDIRDIRALAASRSPLANFSDLDTFALNRAGWYIQDVSEAGIRDNLAWGEVRITDLDGGDWFQVDLWEGSRISLINAGGSHHFAAARWIAGRLALPTPLSGRLVIHSLNPASVNQITSDYHMVAIPGDDWEVWEAILGVEAPVVCMRMPYPAHDFLLFLFPVTDRRSTRVAALLRQYGALDVNRWLQQQLSRQAKALLSLQVLVPMLKAEKSLFVDTDVDTSGLSS